MNFVFLVENLENFRVRETTDNVGGTRVDLTCFLFFSSVRQREKKCLEQLEIQNTINNKLFFSG